MSLTSQALYSSLSAKEGSTRSQNNEDNLELYTVKHMIERVVDQKTFSYDAKLQKGLEKKDTFVLPRMDEETDELENVEIDEQVGDDDDEDDDGSNQEIDEGIVKEGLIIDSTGDDNNNECSNTRIVPFRLHSSLSLTVAEPKKKGIQEPRPPRNAGVHTYPTNNMVYSISTNSRGDRKSRSKKFQFPENLMLEEGGSVSLIPSSSSPSCPNNRTARRRFSATAAMTTTVPLRRKSFTLTKGTGLIKSLPSIEEHIPPPLSSTSTSRLHTRRKSTSACYSRTRRNSVRSPLPFSFPKHVTHTKSTTHSQMIVRVRERKLDGIPEIVISKRMTRPILVWHWHDRHLHLPHFGTIIPLGPHQHGVMLRQLRYVKSVMHDFPWAKTHLKEMLALYTKKEMTKEELYPQLNLLSTQVTDDRLTLIKKQQLLMIKKQKLTTQLSVATHLINELVVTKYGRRGKPHDTKLYFDPGQPTTLHWIRKNGEFSREGLHVDQIQIQYYDTTQMYHGTSSCFKKLPPSVISETCLSLYTPLRTLDLQVKTLLHREWLVGALTDIISFAQQYKAAGEKREVTSMTRVEGSSPGTTHILRRM